MDGIFITFEGGEGTGKSTQLALLAEVLEQHGYVVRTIREPGGTSVGERVRDILLDNKEAALDSVAELLLYEAARAQIVAEVIRPALNAGEIVLCDRFFDSTLAYQGYGRGLGAELVQQLNDAATSGLYPKRTLLLMVDPAFGIKRAAKVSEGGADRIESAPLDFHQRVYDGFDRLAQEQPQRVRFIDAHGSIEEVQTKVWEEVRDLFPEISFDKQSK